MTITVDGSLLDWTQDDRLETSANTVDGYQIYGRVENDTFYLALQSAVAIGPNTTFWLNTDDNPNTGLQIFTAYGGAEYYINFDAAGVPHLYDALTNALVSDLVYSLSGDGLTLEIAIPRSTLGGSATSLGILADVNDSVFLPSFYDHGYYALNDPSVPSQFDGVLDEWTAAERLDHGTNVVAGYEVYGKFADDAFIFGLKSDQPIDVGTTFWFNTDRSNSSGYQIFGWALGAEYNVNISGDGVARLYTGAAGETFVANIDYKIAPDGKSIEFALPKSVIGDDVTRVDMLADVNDTTFLPGDYTSAPFTVTDPASIGSPTTDDGYRIAIVYSETTASAYWSDTGYSQLFMAAQSQAMAAGIPYDILTEADLTDVAKLSGYDAIVFPSFQNVPANYSEIANALSQVVFDHHVPLITAGNFMTSDASGNPLPGDAYAIMKQLLGVNVAGAASGEIDLIAGGSEITDSYADGQLIREYANAGTQFFEPFGGFESTVIAEQSVNGGAAQNAVIGTVTGGRNVHFATDGFLADNNLLGKALDWVTDDPGEGPQLSLHMTRNTAIVSSRTDVDQAMEQSDIDAGLLQSLNSYLQQWKADYNFVGTYYVDIGLYPEAEQTTDWAVSKPYYDQILAMGNEIGSHSFSHPQDTNFLFPETLTQEVLDQIKAAYANPAVVPNNPPGNFTPYGLREDADPAVIQQLASMSLEEINQRIAAAKAASDPTTLDPVDRALLEATYQFQFETSRQVLESHLGIPIVGAAVPGMPESHATASNILPYYDYVNGGASFVGAGYPGAFGYMSPSQTDSIYLGPNMLFDFTLIEWQGMTPEQAATEWVAEFNTLSKNSDMPIIVWPWHDYGPTEWMIDPPNPSPYSPEMYTAFIQAAHNAGVEFVTAADLAERIETFSKTDFAYSVSGNTITATVTPQTGTLGTFALDIDSMGTGQLIQSVTGWYAYDNDSVFLDADGGTFEIQLGTAQDDVTHITSIDQRAQLLSLTGDGTNLTFTIHGEGKVVVDVKGGVGYTVTGASYSMDGEIMTIDLGGLGTHEVSIQQQLSNNAGLGDLPITVVAMERASTDTPLKLSVPADPDGDTQTFVVTALPSSGQVMLAGAAALAIGQRLTQAEFESLTFSFPDIDPQDLTLSFQVDDGQGHLDPFNVTLRVTEGVNSVLNGTPQADRLDGAWGDDTVTGLGSNDTLIGGIGNDVLDGGAGADAMHGGPGNDTFHVDNAGDQVFENPGEGNDTVLTSVSYALVAGQEVETLSAENTSATTALDLTGNEFANTLIGTNGANTLDGGAGADTMTGLGGNDTYIVDDPGDKVVEAAGGGTDTVMSSVSYTLPVNVENLTLTGSDNINGIGNALNNVITGNAGNNRLDGAGGDDRMIGGAGDDTYVVNSSGDTVVEQANGGTDTVQSSITYILPNNVENLTLIGNAGIHGAGNNLDNTILGNDAGNALAGGAGNDLMHGGGGTDALDGGAGNDVLNGGLGNDFLFGGSGKDMFSFTTPLGPNNVDYLLDFNPHDDTIVLDDAIFTALTLGNLSAAEFKTGLNNVATSPTQHIIHNYLTGWVGYDPDGNGSAAAIQFAQVLPLTNLTANDFLVV